MEGCPTQASLDDNDKTEKSPLSESTARRYLHIQGLIKQTLEAERCSEPFRSSAEVPPEVGVVARPVLLSMSPRHREIQATIGALVGGREVSEFDQLVPVDMDKLTKSMICQIQFIKEIFMKFRAVKKMEFILNKALYVRYIDARRQLENLGRNTAELFVFHGTEQGNVDQILTRGFLVGGMGGFPFTHGSSKGNGIYFSADPAMVERYNIGHTGASGRRMIAVRILTGLVSDKAIYGPAGAIGEDEFDSHFMDGTHVIRRSCQTLPFCVVYY